MKTIRSKSFGTENSLSYRGGGASFLWNTLVDSIKNERTVLAFKKKIKIGLEKSAPAGSATILLFCI